MVLVNYKGECMKKIVSKNGYSLFFEKKDNDEIDCIAYETGKHLTGQDVANQLNITRSAICQSLKRSIKRIFYRLKKNNNIFSTVEIIATMAVVFNVNTESEYRNFFRLFPENIKGEVHEEAYKIGYYKN
jgi:predicted transcriptional regulator